jgi:hypothetical protein
VYRIAVLPPLYLLALASALGGRPLLAAQAPEPHLVRTAVVGGYLWAVAVDGHVAYAAIGPRLVAVDVSDREHPRELGQSPPLAGTMTLLAARGGTAFAVVGSRLRMLDVSDPAHMNRLAELDLPRAGIEHRVRILQWVGDRLALGQGPRLLIYDVRHPRAPLLLGVYDHPLVPGSLGSIYRHFDGQRAYAVVLWTDGHMDLHLIDTSDPGHIRPVAALASDEALGDLTGQGRHLYLSLQGESAVGRGRVAVMDLADPASPRELASLPLSVWRARVFLHRDRLYITEFDGWSGLGVRVADVRDPAHPVPGELLELSRRVRVVGADEAGAVLVADGSPYGLAQNIYPDGAALWRLDAPAEGPPLLGQPFRGLAGPRTVAAGRGRAYVAGWDALHILDTTDPAAPRQLAELPGRYFLVATNGTRLLATRTEPPGADLVDVSDPARPRIVASVREPSDPAVPFLAGAKGLWWSGDRLVTTGRNTAVAVFDTSGPGAPRLLGTYAPADLGSVEDGFVDVVVHGRYAYAFEWEKADVYVVDLTDPEEPRALARVGPHLSSRGSHGGWSKRMALSAGYLLVADWERGLRVLDLADLSRPYDVSASSLRGAGVAVDGDRAYLYGLGGLTVARLHGHSAPEAVAEFDLQANYLALDGEFVYAADSYGSFQVWRWTSLTGGRAWLPYVGTMGALHAPAPPPVRAEAAVRGARGRP